MNDRLRSEIGTRTIKDIVSGTRGELMAGAKKALNSGQDSTSELGIEVVDVRVKQINLPDEVSSSIYQRMRAERDAVAREHRSQGKEKAAFIQADVDRKVTLILANANKTAQNCVVMVMQPQQNCILKLLHKNHSFIALFVA